MRKFLDLLADTDSGTGSDALGLVWFDGMSVIAMIDDPSSMADVRGWPPAGRRSADRRHHDGDERA